MKFMEKIKHLQNDNSKYVGGNDDSENFKAFHDVGFEQLEAFQVPWILVEKIYHLGHQYQTRTLQHIVNGYGYGWDLYWRLGGDGVKWVTNLDQPRYQF